MRGGLAHATRSLARRTLTRPEDVHPDDFARLTAHVKRARESGAATWETLQFRRRRKDGSWAEVEASGSCECAPTRLACVSRDR